MASWTRPLRQRAKCAAALAGALLATGWVVAPAGAATEIGQLGPATDSCVAGRTYVQDIDGDPPSYRVPPGGGVITRWTVRQGSGSGTSLKLRMLRPEGGSTYRTVGDSAIHGLAPSTDNTFQVGPPGIAVQEGDVLGVRTVAGNPNCIFSSGSGAVRSTTTDAAPGASAFYGSGQAPYRLNLTALVEPDRDGDGRGDDTQDSDDDDDGLSDAAEIELGTNPAAADTDGDGRRDAADRCPLASAGTADGCPPPAPPDPGDTAAPGVALAGFPARLRRRAFLTRGLRGTATPSEPSSFEVRLLGTLSGARITRAGDVVLAERALPLAAGPRSVTLRVAARVRRRLARRLRLRLEVRATDAAGNRTLVSRRITVR